MNEVIESLSKSLSPISQMIKDVFIFGSFARGAENYNDIDVLIVHKKTKFDSINHSLLELEFDRPYSVAPQSGYYVPTPVPPKPSKNAPFHIVFAEDSLEDNPSLFERVRRDLVRVPIC